MSDYKTTCILCRKEFSAAGVDAYEPGKPIPPRTGRMIAALVKHLEAEHKSILIGAPSGMYEVLMAAAQEFFAYLVIVRTFQSEDPNIALFADAARHSVHALTRARRPPTNEEIEQRVSEIFGDFGAAKKITKEQAIAQTAIALVELRDVLTEQGKFAPGIPQEQPQTVEV